MKNEMRTIGFRKALPIADSNSLEEHVTTIPTPTKRELLVKIISISVNPVDTKLRQNPANASDELTVLGFDAYGEVVATGSNTTFFTTGDRVFYAGSVKKQGANSEYQLIDERLVGHAPTRLAPEEIAAMPLTSITAWESLFEKLQIDPTATLANKQQTVLIINGAGGVGSIAIQLAKWAGLNVIATASRNESTEWCKKMGADIIINHHQPLLPQLQAQDIHDVELILCLHSLDAHWQNIVDCLAPEGKICAIVDNEHPIDLRLLKNKSATFSYEWMFTKSFYETENMISQHTILEDVAALLDKGILTSTVTQTLRPINVENLKKAHALVEQNKMIGKLTLTDFD